MTPTSDERREVAEKLMELAEGNAAVECSKVAHALGLEYEVHGCIAAFGRADVTALADFIDPTCHVRGFGHPDEFRVVKGCSVCHCGWYEDVFDRPYRYCPHCGARVVDDDE